MPVLSLHLSERLILVKPENKNNNLNQRGNKSFYKNAELNPLPFTISSCNSFRTLLCLLAGPLPSPSSRRSYSLCPAFF